MMMKLAILFWTLMSVQSRSYGKFSFFLTVLVKKSCNYIQLYKITTKPFRAEFGIFFFVERLFSIGYSFFVTLVLKFYLYYFRGC